MKRIHLFNYIKLLALFVLILQSCQKGELLETKGPQIVELSFSGSTSIPLEFIYNGSVVGTTVGGNHSLPIPFTLNVSKGDQKIHIREKGKTVILKSYTINTAVFQQKFGILYDDGKIYDNSMFYHLLIHPLGKDVEIFLDGKIKDQTSYGATLNSKLTIPMDKGQIRQLTVKIKGTDEIILSRTIAEADSNKTLKFFLDGKKAVENMTLPALRDPKGMSMTFLLRPDVENGQTAFLGGDVDLVFYLRDLMTDEVTPISPEIRFTVPQGQSFVTLELPPLPDSKMYTFDVFKKGTKEVAYNSLNPGYSVQPGLGKHGGLYFFRDLQISFFFPGERLVCKILVAEELGGNNFDEIYITPGEINILNDFVNIR